MNRDNYYVIYWDHLRGKAAREAKAIFGADFEPGPLPHELSMAEISPQQDESVNRFIDKARGREGVIIEPAIGAIEEMTENDARRAAWQAVRGPGGLESEDVELEAIRSYPRCWGILFLSSREYPGIGVVIDKHTGRAFLRRYIDLKPVMLPGAPMRRPVE